MEKREILVLRQIPADENGQPIIEGKSFTVSEDCIDYDQDLNDFCHYYKDILEEKKNLEIFEVKGNYIITSDGIYQAVWADTYENKFEDVTPEQE